MGGDLEVYEKAFMRIDEHLRRIFGDLLERARAPEEGR